jgi:alpha-mannosidase
MTRLTFHLIPHVHWDREWYHSRAAFTTRLIPLVSQVLAALEQAVALRFHLDGQAVLVEDHLAIVPGDRARIEALVRRGQLGIGPWYVLADELIPAGESLRKNLEVGTRIGRALGGVTPVLYSPDAFGHPGGLPSLAAAHGIKWGLVWRGLGRVGGVERDLYRWVGPEGHALLLHHLPPQGYEMAIHLVTAGPALAAAWNELRSQLIARAVTREIAVLVGADHHAPDPRLAELAGRIQALEPEAVVRFSSLTEYFLAVEAAAPALTEIRGELRSSSGYVWSLQGVHSSRSRMKRSHARAEAALIQLGDSPAAPAGARWAELLDHAWRTLLQCQFHDTIAGCCSDAVAREQRVRLDGVIAMAGRLAEDSIHRLTGHDPDLARERPDRAAPVVAVWNRNPEPYSGVAIALTRWFRGDVLVGPPGSRAARDGSGYRPFHLTSPNGTPCPVQLLRVETGHHRAEASRHYPDLDRVDRAWIAFPTEVPGSAAAVHRVARGPGPPVRVTHPVVGAAGALDNGLVRISVDRGGLVKLFDRETGATYRRLCEIESETDHGDLYTPAIDPTTRRVARRARVRSLAEGPLVGALAVEWMVAPAGGGQVNGRTVVSLHADESRVGVRIEFDNWASDHRLRLRFPATIGQEHLAGAPLGTERRSPGRLDRSWLEEATLPTAPASGSIESADPARPFRLELEGTVEYQVTARGDLLVTLLRAVGELSRSDNRARRGHAGWPTPTPEAQEPGRHEIDLVLVTGADLDRGPRRLPLSWFIPPCARDPEP